MPKPIASHLPVIIFERFQREHQPQNGMGDQFSLMTIRKMEVLVALLSFILIKHKLETLSYHVAGMQNLTPAAFPATNRVQLS